MDELTLWERIVWWWWSRVWSGLTRRCAYCGSPFCEEDDPREGYTHFLRSERLGLGWICDGCTSYPEG